MHLSMRGKPVFEGAFYILVMQSLVKQSRQINARCYLLDSPGPGYVKFQGRQRKDEEVVSRELLGILGLGFPVNNGVHSC